MESKKENSMIIHILIPFVLVMSGCTFSINMAHSQGLASDLIDDTTAATPTANITVPELEKK